MIKMSNETNTPQLDLAESVALDTLNELKDEVANVAYSKKVDETQLARFKPLWDVLSPDDVTKDPMQLLKEVNEFLAKSVIAGWELYESAIKSVREKWLEKKLNLKHTNDFGKFNVSVEDLLMMIWKAARSHVDEYLTLLNSQITLEKIAPEHHPTFVFDKLPQFDSQKPKMPDVANNQKTDHTLVTLDSVLDKKNKKGKSFTAGFAEGLNYYVWDQICLNKVPIGKFLTIESRELNTIGDVCRSYGPHTEWETLLDHAAYDHVVPVIFSGFRIIDVDIIVSESIGSDVKLSLMENHKPRLKNEFVGKGRFRQCSSAVFYGKDKFGTLRSNINPFNYFNDKYAFEELRRVLMRYDISTRPQPNNKRDYIGHTLSIDRCEYQIELKLGVEYHLGMIRTPHSIIRLEKWNELRVIERYFTVRKLSSMTYEDGDIDYTILKTRKPFPEKFSKFAVVPQIATNDMKKLPPLAYGHAVDVSSTSVCNLLTLHPGLFYNLALCAIKSNEFRKPQKKLCKFIFEGICSELPTTLQRVTAVAKISLTLIRLPENSPAIALLLNEFIEFLGVKFFKPLFRCYKGQVISWGVPYSKTYLGKAVFRQFDEGHKKFNKVFPIIILKDIGLAESTENESSMLPAIRKLKSMNISECVDFLYVMIEVLKNRNERSVEFKQQHPDLSNVVQNLRKIVEEIKVQPKMKDELVNTIESLKYFAYPHKSTEQMVNICKMYVENVKKIHDDSETIDDNLFDASVHKGMEGCQVSFQQNVQSGQQRKMDKYFHRKFSGINIGSSQKHCFRNEYLSVGNETVLRLYYLDVCAKDGDGKVDLAKTLGLEELKDLGMPPEDMSQAFEEYAGKALEAAKKGSKKYRMIHFTV